MSAGIGIALGLPAGSQAQTQSVPLEVAGALEAVVGRVRDVGVPFLLQVVSRDTLKSWITHLGRAGTDASERGLPTGLRDELLEVLESALAFAACSDIPEPGLRPISPACYEALLRHRVGMAVSANEYYQAAASLASLVSTDLRTMEGGGHDALCRSRSQGPVGSRLGLMVEHTLRAVGPMIGEYSPGPPAPMPDVHIRSEMAPDFLARYQAATPNTPATVILNSVARRDRDAALEP